MSIVVFLTFSAHFGLVVKDNGAVSLGLKLVGNGKTTRTSTYDADGIGRMAWGGAYGRYQKDYRGDKPEGEHAER